MRYTIMFLNTITIRPSLGEILESKPLPVTHSPERLAIHVCIVGATPMKASVARECAQIKPGVGASH